VAVVLEGEHDMKERFGYARTISVFGFLASYALIAPSPASAQIEIIDSTGDGVAALENSAGIALEGSDNAFVTARTSNNAFKITPGGTISEIINATGDGAHALDFITFVAADSAGNAYVTGQASDNVFRISAGGAISEIIDFMFDFPWTRTTPISSPG
jgi:hypothetical protein